MALTIRPAGPADVAVIAEFNARLAEESERTQLDAALLASGVAAVLADPQKGWYRLACDEGCVVGQAAVTFEWSDWRNGWWWWLQSVYVRPEARGRGVFRAVYADICEAAQRAGDVIGIRLYVERNNQVGQSAYRQIGMTRTNYEVHEQLLGPKNP
jgi:GNAT superfamily N-acetyltransferase